MLGWSASAAANAQAKPRQLRAKRAGNGCGSQLDNVQFWPRLEMSRLFVLRELQPILFASLCRLEMRTGHTKLMD